MSSKKLLEKIHDEKVAFIDLRFCDTRGKEQHVTLPVSAVDEDFFEEGKMFDGSSIAGWKGINESDMVLMPDNDSAVLDPTRWRVTTVARARWPSAQRRF
jgi:glutamine synthetase